MDNAKLQVTPEQYTEICNSVFGQITTEPVKQQRMSNCFSGISRYFFKKLNDRIDKGDPLKDLIDESKLLAKSQRTKASR